MDYRDTIEREVSKIFNILDLDEEQKSYDHMQRNFVGHFVGAENLVYESACVHHRVQEHGGSVDQFAATLRTLAQKCGSGTLKKRTIHDRFILGLQD